ncbi:ATP-dependent endonuclease [Pasteurellaceae bacterium LIM206]|nr:ATP-dependent endonuclease [Pasteurellaceae bacterium LIM206]
MYLRQLDIAGFRGIKRLSIHLRPNMVLIGENTWGKSSLLAALSLILNGKGNLYQFVQRDFHIGDDSNGITLLFTFSESKPTETHSHLTGSERIFVPHEDGFERIYLRVSGEVNEHNQICTEYSFLNEQGNPLVLDNTAELVGDLIYHHPVYRFRDARINPHKVRSFPFKYDADADQITREIYAVMELVKYYFIEDKSLMLEPALLWNYAQSLCLRLESKEEPDLIKRLTQSIATLFESPVKSVDKSVRPILLLEDLETRLHPRMVAIIWKLSTYLPIQRITTTNSAELISQADLRCLCRLVRYPDVIKAYQLARHDLGKEDLRRLTFHVHYNRSLALFSRTWLLVEGETEVWLLSELAELLGIHLDMEGIRIVEFAQAGLRPLIKYARTMGIEWYVLTDGDEAGRKYTDTVRLMLENGRDNLSNRVTTLPKQDIEHFLYTEGFRDVFVRLARWDTENHVFPANKIIQRAIQRSSKPDLAIAIANEVERRGKESIPLLFKRMFSKVLNLTRSQEG